MVDYVKQLEGGLKYKDGPVSFYATAFHSNTEETNFDFGLGFFSNKYRSNGVELEGAFRAGMFSLTGSATYTDAKITAAFVFDNQAGANAAKPIGIVHIHDLLRFGLN